ncbi:MAG: ribonuclease HII [Helicobacter sp.]|nr:ribonuclease HII [Helicobacter sp.]
MNVSILRNICGIDEAGRGCLAGSLFVCGVILKEEIPHTLKKEIKDSKKLSEKKRNFIAPKIKEFCNFYLVQKTPQEIDNGGLSLCLKESLQAILKHLKASEYIFDGNCKFGITSLQTLIKGDSKLLSISVASILAKYAKDQEMRTLDKLYPSYDFKNNKGYGSQAHLRAIQEYGYCEFHRRSYHIKAIPNNNQ